VTIATNRSILGTTTAEVCIVRDLLLLAGRILVAALFIPAGIQTLSNISGSAAYFEGLGLPVPVLTAWSVGLAELGLGALVLIGFQTRLSALALAAFAAMAGYLGHYGQGSDAMLAMMHSQAFAKDIAIAGGLLILAGSGAGRLSLDSWLN
jgi:putative oxidoreductase